MLEPSRSCRRTGCTRPAAASLSFRYATRQVWVGELGSGGDLSRYDLCEAHAQSLTVPRGWDRVDQRPARKKAAPPPATEPAAAPVPEQELLAPAVGASTGDRYARLLAELPRLSAQVRHPEGGRMEGDQASGQLAIPVADGEGVVVSLRHYVGSRRRAED